MSYAKVSSFFDYVRKKGVVASNTVTGWSGAFSAVELVLDDAEKDLDFILSNSDVIRNRLQNQNHEISGGTLNVYIQRTNRAINAFREWDKDRAAWEKKMASAAPAKSSPTSSSKVTAKPKINAHQETISTKNDSLNSTSKTVFPIPTSSGETFDVALPSSYTMDDLPRVLWALAVYAVDFNPSEVLKRYGNPPLNEVTPKSNKLASIED